MTTSAPSILRDAVEIPQPAASETKLRGSESLPDLGSLEGDWPTLSVLSRRYIDRALGHTHGNKTRAADMLGIDRRTLNRIMVRDRAKKSKPPIAAE